MSVIDWIYRDPLRGVSIDKFPYSRCKDECRLDFVFKGCLYGGSLTAGLIAGPLELIIMIVLWLSINFFRRNGENDIDLENNYSRNKRLS